MCMICNDWNNSENNMVAVEQTIRNLFEEKERVGVKHTNEILALINVNYNYPYTKDNLHLNAIVEFVTPEPEPVIDRKLL
jgi:hypothetical protein